METEAVPWSKVTDWLVQPTEKQLIGGYSLKAMCEYVREEYGFLNGEYAEVEKALASPA